MTAARAPRHAAKPPPPSLWAWDARSEAAARAAFRPAAVRRMLDAGARVDERGHDLRTPLMVAAGRHGHPESVRMLLAAGADVHARDKDDWTPLMASIGGHPDGIRALLAAGADPAAVAANGGTVLYQAAVTRSWHGLDVLLEAGVRDGVGRAADIAVEDMRVLQVLLRHGVVDPDRCLGGAIRSWRVEAVRHLLTVGAAPDAWMAGDRPWASGTAAITHPLARRRMAIVAALHDGAPVPPVRGADVAWLTGAVSRHPRAPWAMTALAACG